MLVVEDNADLLDFLCGNLKSQYNVSGANDGEEALRLLKASEFDIIVSDIAMPKKDGFQLLREVRTDHMLSHIPFILLSAETSVESKIKGLERGADAYIEKPFSLNHFCAMIDNLIKGRQLLQSKFSSEPLEKYSRDAMDSSDAEWLEKVDRCISEWMTDENFSIDRLACEMFMSRSNFQRKIKGLVNMTPNEYVKLIRLKKAAELLAEGRYRINEVCYIVGFNNASYFSNCFQKQFGVLPKDFITNISKHRDKGGANTEDNNAETDRKN